MQEAYLRLHWELVEESGGGATAARRQLEDGRPRQGDRSPHPVVGAVKVARLLIGAFGKLRDHGIQIEHIHVGGHQAVRMHDPTNETIEIWSLLITDGTIVAIHGVMNPDKLTHL